MDSVTFFQEWHVKMLRSHSYVSHVSLYFQDIARVSFKECNLDQGLREDCGYFGIDEEGCYQRECCWGETSTPGVPWCYHSKR